MNLLTNVISQNAIVLLAQSLPISRRKSTSIFIISLIILSSLAYNKNVILNLELIQTVRNDTSQYALSNNYRYSLTYFEVFTILRLIIGNKQLAKSAIAIFFSRMSFIWFDISSISL